MNGLIAVIALSLSVLTSLVAVTAVIVQMKTNVTRLTEREGVQDAREEKAAKELTELLVLLKSFMSAQTEINRTVELGLSGVVNQLREMEKRTVESATVVSLLTEVLKKTQKGYSIEP